jgi:transcriptional regulator with XRE-family HTH domain
MQNLSHLLTLVNQLLTILFTLLLAIWQELRNARRAHGWTIEEAAEAVGVDTSTYHRWELGTQRPYPSNMLKLSHVLRDIEYNLILSSAIEIGYNFSRSSIECLAPPTDIYQRIGRVTRHRATERPANSRRKEERHESY